VALQKRSLNCGCSWNRGSHASSLVIGGGQTPESDILIPLGMPSRRGPAARFEVVRILSIESSMQQLRAANASELLLDTLGRDLSALAPIL
jgi:hypothetical protein